MPHLDALSKHPWFHPTTNAVTKRGHGTRRWQWEALCMASTASRSQCKSDLQPALLLCHDLGDWGWAASETKIVFFFDTGSTIMPFDWKQKKKLLILSYNTSQQVNNPHTWAQWMNASILAVGLSQIRSRSPKGFNAGSAKHTPWHSLAKFWDWKETWTDWRKPHSSLHLQTGHSVLIKV